MPECTPTASPVPPRGHGVWPARSLLFPRPHLRCGLLRRPRRPGTVGHPPGSRGRPASSSRSGYPPGRAPRSPPHPHALALWSPGRCAHLRAGIARSSAVPSHRSRQPRHDDETNTRRTGSAESTMVTARKSPLGVTPSMSTGDVAGWSRYVGIGLSSAQDLRR